MKDLTVTAYRGYTNVAGKTTLTQTVEEIRNGKYIHLIRKIERLMAEGKDEEANRVKAQLPYRTLTGNYAMHRRADSLVRYNPVITLDIDKLDPAQVGPLRQKLKEDPHVLASFLSPRRHGFKFFAYLQTPYAVQLRQCTFRGITELPYTALTRHHATMYEACRVYYENLLGVKIDTSGKDIARGFFLSFDVEAYLNPELLAEIEEVEVKIAAGKDNTEQEPAGIPRPGTNGIELRHQGTVHTYPAGKRIQSNSDALRRVIEHGKFCFAIHTDRKFTFFKIFFFFHCSFVGFNVITML